MVRLMRIYYLFKARNKNLRARNMYLVLEELFYLNSNKFNYGLTIFNELCLPFNKRKIIDELKSRFLCVSNKIFVDNLEDTIIEFNNIFIVIKTNKNFPEIFKYISNLESNILVCDFTNKDYFFLNDFVRLNFKLSI